VCKQGQGTIGKDYLGMKFSNQNLIIAGCMRTLFEKERSSNDLARMW
jgi:hypothetical protein